MKRKGDNWSEEYCDRCGGYMGFDSDEKRQHRHFEDCFTHLRRIVEGHPDEASRHLNERDGER